jgi:hypothetical protein
LSLPEEEDSLLEGEDILLGEGSGEDWKARS